MGADLRARHQPRPVRHPCPRSRPGPGDASGRAADLITLASCARPQPVADLAVRALTAIAETEARLHAASPAEVHLHELGGHDTLIDIVGTAAALHALGVNAVHSSPLYLGAGHVREVHHQAKIRPAGHGAHSAPRRGRVHRTGPARRDRRHQPLRLGTQARGLGGLNPYCPRQRPDRPPRAHLQTGPGPGTVGAVPGGADRQAAPGLRRRLPGHRQTARSKIATTAIAHGCM